MPMPSFLTSFSFDPFIYSPKPVGRSSLFEISAAAAIMGIRRVVRLHPPSNSIRNKACSHTQTHPYAVYFLGSGGGVAASLDLSLRRAAAWSRSPRCCAVSPLLTKLLLLWIDAAAFFLAEIDAPGFLDSPSSLGFVVLFIGERLAAVALFGSMEQSRRSLSTQTPFE